MNGKTACYPATWLKGCTRLASSNMPEVGAISRKGIGVVGWCPSYIYYPGLRLCVIIWIDSNGVAVGGTTLWCLPGQHHGTRVQRLSIYWFNESRGRSTCSDCRL